MHTQSREFRMDLALKYRLHSTDLGLILRVKGQVIEQDCMSRFVLKDFQPPIHINKPQGQ